MTEQEERLEEVSRIAASVRTIVGPDLYGKACAEVTGCVPPWAKEGLVCMDAEAIHALMVAAWLRGFSARAEVLS